MQVNSYTSLPTAIYYRQRSSVSIADSIAYRNTLAGCHGNGPFVTWRACNCAFYWRAVDGGKSAEVQSQQGVAKAMRQTGEYLLKTQATCNPAIRGALSGGLLHCVHLAPAPWRVVQHTLEFCPPIPAENLFKYTAGMRIAGAISTT